MIGSKVRKFFKGHGYFEGTVVSYKESLGYYLVVYEDDDEEEFTEENLRKFLVADDDDAPATSERKRKAAQSKAVTEDMEESEMSSEEEEEEDDESDEYSYESDAAVDDQDEIDFESFIDKEAKTSTPTTPKRAARGRKPVAVTPSPSFSRSTSTVSVSFSSNSIAQRGLPRGALGRCARTGFTIRSLESIAPLVESPSSTATRTPRKQRKARNVSDPLAGQIMVIAADDEGLCPAELVGKSFNSGSDLHKALAKEHRGGNADKAYFATYEMEAVADPAFAPWGFIKARLSSAGLDTKDTTPMAVKISYDEEEGRIDGDVVWYGDAESDFHLEDDLDWALIEGDRHSDIPPVLVGVPRSLLYTQTTETAQVNIVSASSEDILEEEDDNEGRGGGENDLLPPPSKHVSQIRLPASLLQKSIRRGRGICSPTPLLEACTKLLHPDHAQPGSTLAMLKAVWGCMLVDAAPFQEATGCAGLDTLLLLSLIAKADPQWSMPPNMRRSVISAALRAASSTPSQPWVGYVERDEKWWELESTSSLTDDVLKATKLRNTLRATQAAAGGRVAWGQWNKFVGDTSAAAALAYLNHEEWDGSQLPAPPEANANEGSLLKAWEQGKSFSIPTEPRLQHLDQECRLSAVEPTVFPYSLVLLQATLENPPSSWKKHSLTSLARQVRKLISEVNPRTRQRVQLARLATWGKDSPNTRSTTEQDQSENAESYKSFREVVTPTGTLSDGETEIIDCFEAIQKLQLDQLDDDTVKVEGAADNSTMAHSDESGFQSCLRVKAGSPPTASDGRVAFLLAFASAVEIDVVPDPKSPSAKETVSVMFAGTESEPLLVQRIGKARKEGQELATAGGSSSGATAVPSLGYVQRNRSVEESKLMAAAEAEVARMWEGGRSFSLPIPPPNFQWDLPQVEAHATSSWEDAERDIPRTAKLLDDGNGNRTWHFSVGGVVVKPFDARAVISPCALDFDDDSHPAVLLDHERDRLLRISLYVKDEEGSATPLPRGGEVLDTMSALHLLANSTRANAPSEGVVFNWMPLAYASVLPARTWRDALLAIRTRDRDHVLLGKGIRADGAGAARDMTEGVLVRLFHALEMLYPTALRKEGAMKFRVRPRGGAYFHMMVCLERLGRDGRELVAAASALESDTAKSSTATLKSCGSTALEEHSPRRRPRRLAAIAASKKAASQLQGEENGDGARPRKRLKRGDDDYDDACADMEDDLNSSDEECGEDDWLPIPKLKTSLWPHQEASVSKVLEGVREGKRGHADASAVGSGKTLTALATITRLAKFIEETGRSRHGVLVMLPTKALIREWLLEIATHTEGFNVSEQREDGSLFSLTYGKSDPPIDGNALVISTLDRVCRHPFVRQVAWDFVVIDECLAVQNAAAKRNPSAWRQIEISTCGCLMLSATFFRSKFDSLFYMIRMLRSPLPRTMEWLPATIHEHIVCHVPETDRTWQLKGEMVPLNPPDLKEYRGIIESFRRRQLNERGNVDGRTLWVDLEVFLRSKYEGRDTRSTYCARSVMSDAFAKSAKGLLGEGRRPLIFADTSQEASFLVRTLCSAGLDARSWADIASERVASSASKSKQVESNGKRVIVAVKSIEGQGINMQGHADAILCRPTPGDHLEQMKGRIDRPGQRAKDLILVVLMAEHTIEEAKFANIRLAGNFFRERLAPVASRFRERLDLEATMAAANGKAKLKRGTVSSTWQRLLEKAGQSGAFAAQDKAPDDEASNKSGNSTEVAPLLENTVLSEKKDDCDVRKPKAEPKYKPLNKVIRNKGDPLAVREAKALAKSGRASRVVRQWLFPLKAPVTGLAQFSLERFSDQSPPLVLDRETVQKAVTHLSKNCPKLATLIARVGADALINDCGTPKAPTQASLFDRCLRAITFTMVSVDAGNAFLRRLAIKLGVCIENMSPTRRKQHLTNYLKDIQEAGDSEIEDPHDLLNVLLQGYHNEIVFSHELIGELVDTCEIIDGKRTGYPHLCGVSFPCGKSDDPAVFLQKARDHAKGGTVPVSAGFSSPKAGFIVSLVQDFVSGKISGEKIAKASDRDAARMLMDLKGIGDWSAGGVLMHSLCRADIMLYGDLTVRNYLNDLYDINHADSSETLLESAADFGDTRQNRNLIDDVSKKHGWEPYRSVVCLLMYHLQEENLVLL